MQAEAVVVVLSGYKAQVVLAVPEVMAVVELVEVTEALVHQVLLTLVAVAVAVATVTIQVVLVDLAVQA